MTRTIAAAVFALLAFTVPARAAYVDAGDIVDYAELNYPTGQLDGIFDFSGLPAGGGFSLGQYIINVEDAEFNRGPFSYPLTPLPGGSLGPGTGVILLSGVPQTVFQVSVNLTDLPNLTYADFSGITSGTVTLLSDSPPNVSPAPLPPALPLFATGITLLAGVAAVRKSRRVARG